METPWHLGCKCPRATQITSILSTQGNTFLVITVPGTENEQMPAWFFPSIPYCQTTGLSALGTIQQEETSNLAPTVTQRWTNSPLYGSVQTLFLWCFLSPFYYFTPLNINKKKLGIPSHPSLSSRPGSGMETHTHLQWSREATAEWNKVNLSQNSQLKTSLAPVFIHIYPTFILHLLPLKPSLWTFCFFPPDLLTPSHSNHVHREALASASPSWEWEPGVRADLRAR